VEVFASSEPSGTNCPTCGQPIIDGLVDTYLTIVQAMERVQLRRTVMYELARYWERTGGPFGLPSVKVASAIRIPERALAHSVAHGLLCRGADKGASDDVGAPERETGSPDAATRFRADVEPTIQNVFQTLNTTALPCRRGADTGGA
jgi:hypothetical protein